MKAGLFFPGKRRHLFEALHPETRFTGGRSKAEVALKKDGLHINIRSEDVTSLRAATNAYLRMAKAAITCLEVI